MKAFTSQFLESTKYFGLRKLYYLTKNIYQEMVEYFTDKHFIRDELHQSLLKRDISRRLVSRYSGDSGQNTNTTQYFLGFGLIHYALVRNTKPAHILCIGSRKGFIPAILALACRDNHTGHVDFVDPGYDQKRSAQSWGGIGWWKSVNALNHFRVLGINSQITLHVMRSVDFAKKYPQKRYQYIYVDGDHSYRGVKRDYELFWPRLEQQGFMALHDVVARGRLEGGRFGVHRLWQELNNAHTIIFPFPKVSGLGFIQKT